MIIRFILSPEKEQTFIDASVDAMIVDSLFHFIILFHLIHS